MKVLSVLSRFRDRRVLALLAVFLMVLPVWSTGPLAITVRAAAMEVATIPGTNIAEGVELPEQRASFIAHGRDWAFFPYVFGGANLLAYSSSSDSGATWSAPTSTADPVEQYWAHEFSLYYDRTLDYVHVVLSGEEESSTYYRRGRPASGGSISWTAAWQTVLTSSFSTLWPCITVDSNGYPWISFSKAIPAIPSDTQPYVIKSSKNDGTWTTAASFPYQLSSSTTKSWKTAIVALSSNNVYVAYGCNGSHPLGYIFGKLYTSGVGWGTQEYVDGAYGGSKFSQEFSLITDGTELHVLYMKRYVPTGQDYVNIRHGYRGSGTPSYWVDQEDVVTGLVPTGMIRAAGSYADSTNALYAVYWDSSDSSLKYCSLSLDLGNTGTWSSSSILDTGQSLVLGTRINVGMDDLDEDRIGVLWYLPGSRKVMYDSFKTVPLEATGLLISNWEGCGNWLYAQQRFYNIEAQWSVLPGTSLDWLEVRFTDGFSNITLTYDAVYDEWSVSSGSEAALTKRGTFLNVSSGGVNLINVTFPLYLTDQIIDAYDVDFYQHGNTSAGYDTGWQLTAPALVHIYNTGGKQEFAFTGTGGHRYGGDAWEIYAGGYYAPADIWSEEFPGTDLGGWVTQTFQDESTLNKIAVVDYPYYTPYFSCYLTDGVQGSPYPNMVHTFDQYISEDFSVSLWVRFETNTTGFHIVYVQGNSSGATGKVGAVRFGYGSDFDTMYVDWDASITGTSFNFNTGTWYNLTMSFNWSANTYSVYVNGVCYASDWGTVLDDWSVHSLKLEVDYQYAVTPPTFRVDDISVFKENSGGYTGTATSTAAYRKLQHIQIRHSIAIPQGEAATVEPGEGYVEWGIDYCDPSHVWVTNGWSVRIGILGGVVDGDNNYVELGVNWYIRGSLEASDTLYVFWEGWEGGNDWFTFYVDLWFNQINGSRVVGGRVTSYYYGMHDSSIPWLRWWSGTDWSPMFMDQASASFFHVLEDSSGNVISSQALDLMKVRGKVWRSNNNLYQWLLRNFDTFQPTQVSYTGKMQGVPTPDKEGTLTPDINTPGFQGILYSGFMIGMSRLAQDIARASWGLWTFFVGALDTIAAYFGAPNFFSNLVSILYSGFLWVAQGFLYIVTFMTSVLIFTTATLASILSGFAQGITIWVGMWGTFWWVIQGMGGAGVDIITVMNLPMWFELFLVAYPMYLVYLWDKEGGGAVQDHLQFIFGILQMIGGGLLGITDWVIAQLSRTIEATPAVE